MRLALALIAFLAAAAPAASADVRLSSRPSSVSALTATGDTAYVVVDNGSTDRPYTVVSSGGSSAKSLGTFGSRRASDPAIAASADGVLLAWSDPISGGLAILGQRVPGPAPSVLAAGTGSAALALREDGAAVVAYPDRSGDTTVSTLPGVMTPSRELGPYDLPDRRRLTSDAPERRHRPLSLALLESGPLVLDLVQTRTRSSFIVAGPRAPSGTVVSVGGLRTIRGTMAADEDTIAVAYASSGRVRLATARPGGAWKTRTLPGATARQPVRGAPAVALDDGDPVVVWSSRPRGASGRELFAWSGSRTRRVTRSRGDDGQPFASPRAGAGIFVAWTRHEDGRRTSLLRRVP